MGSCFPPPYCIAPFTIYGPCRGPRPEHGASCHPPREAGAALASRAHRALSCTGYSRTDFIISDKGPVYLETNTLPGLTRASLYPKALKAQGIEFVDFLHQQIVLAERRRRK